MKKILFVVYVLGIVGLLPSCTILQPFSFERLQAADVSFPEQVKSVGIVNYMPELDWDDESVDYRSGLLEGDGKIATEALAQGIAETGYFSQVVICDSVLCTQRGARDEDMVIQAEMADSLMQALGVDLLFAMERVQIQLKEGVLFMPEVMLEVPAIDGAVIPLVRVYVPGRNAPLYSVSKADTISWELTPELSYNQMVEDASGHAGALSVTHLIPHWKELHRYYFDGGNADMRDAGVYVREQEWKEAADLWHQLYDKRKGKIRMQAAYNLALYYEMQNDLEQAKYYLDAAASLAKEGSGEAQLIMFYQLQLEEQMKQSQRLQLQMKRFEP